MSFDLAMLIRSIIQKDKSTFTIEWGDGTIYDYKLADLQKNCPCIRCGDAKRPSFVSSINPEVQAVRIYNVGRYAMCVEFTDGCSRGVYTFAMLKEWGRLSCGF